MTRQSSKKKPRNSAQQHIYKGVKSKPVLRKGNFSQPENVPKLKKKVEILDNGYGDFSHEIKPVYGGGQRKLKDGVIHRQDGPALIRVEKVCASW